MRNSPCGDKITKKEALKKMGPTRSSFEGTHRFFFYSVFIFIFTRLRRRFLKSTRLGVTRFFLITKSTRFCEFSKKYSVIFTRFLLFDQKVLGWSLLGYPSFCKKYSVKVYSVIALFLRKYSVKITLIVLD